MMSLLTKHLVGECLILINFGANFNLWCHYLALDLVHRALYKTIN